jgi:CheY-like chemotaxis protein
MDQMGTLIQAIAALAWPLIVIIILISFRDVVKAVLDSAKWRKFTIKVGGNELTMEEANEQQRQLISDLQKQIVDIKKTLDAFTATRQVKETESVGMTTDKVKSILWVDDVPRNNATLVETLSNIGIDVVTATSTAEAVAKFESKKFDRIISDMGRNESGQYNRTAGISLINQIRSIDRNIPIVIYSSSRTAQTYRQEALAAGANEITSSAMTLLNALQLGPNMVAT